MLTPSATVVCVYSEEQLKTDKEDTSEAQDVGGGGERDQQTDEIHGKKLGGHIRVIYW